MTALPARMIQASPPALSDLVLEYRGALLHSRVEDRPTSRRGLVPRAVLPAVIRDLQLALRPASENELRMAVARLTTSYPTARPPSPEGYILALLEELSGYPADVVIAAVREVRRTVKFLPAVAEVVEAAEKHVRDRRRMLFAAPTATRRKPSGPSSSRNAGRASHVKPESRNKATLRSFSE
jgi:hypothetical protein